MYQPIYSLLCLLFLISCSSNIKTEEKEASCELEMEDLLSTKKIETISIKFDTLKWYEFEAYGGRFPMNLQEANIKGFNLQLIDCMMFPMAEMCCDTLIINGHKYDMSKVQDTDFCNPEYDELFYFQFNQHNYLFYQIALLNQIQMYACIVDITDSGNIITYGKAGLDNGAEYIGDYNDDGQLDWAVIYDEMYPLGKFKLELFTLDPDSLRSLGYYAYWDEKGCVDQDSSVWIK